jgi:uncharacterized protein (DUF2267 family)
MVPLEYENATIDFRRLLKDARDAAGLVTTNQSFTMLDGVLRTFRRRLDVHQAIAFAAVLPAAARALFVTDWDPGEPRREFGDRADLVEEVKDLRRDHNFSPEDCIDAVAIALRKNVDEAALDRVLAELPSGAREFWAVPPPRR